MSHKVIRVSERTGILLRSLVAMTGGSQEEIAEEAVTQYVETRKIALKKALAAIQKATDARSGKP